MQHIPEASQEIALIVNHLLLGTVSKKFFRLIPFLNYRNCIQRYTNRPSFQEEPQPHLSDQRIHTCNPEHRPILAPPIQPHQCISELTCLPVETDRSSTDTQERRGLHLFSAAANRHSTGYSKPLNGSRKKTYATGRATSSQRRLLDVLSRGHWVFSAETTGRSQQRPLGVLLAE